MTFTEMVTASRISRGYLGGAVPARNFTLLDEVLSVRPRKALKNWHDITTLEALRNARSAGLSDAKLLRMPNFGRRSLNEVKALLDA